MPETLLQLPIRCGGGLDLVDSPEVVAPNGALELENWTIAGAGRWTTRKAARSLGTLTGELIGIFPYGHTTFTPDAGGSTRASAAVALTWDDSTDTVRLYLLDQNGNAAGSKYVGTLAGWSGVSAKPKVTAATLGLVLFVADEGRQYGLTCYDPNDVQGHGVAGGLFQPKFIFDGGAAAPMKVRGVAERQNVLFVWGYGTENDWDRPEAIRFSYLGLEADSGGAGDAGDGATAGSANLFDTEDVFYLSRGVPVIGMCRGADAMMVGTQTGLFRLSGSDRDSFVAVEVDPGRSLASTRAMVDAGGVVYGLSPLGAWRYDGGLALLSRPVQTRVQEMDFDSVFAVHDRDGHQVLFFYTRAIERGQDPDRALVYDYHADAWMEHTYPFRIACAGWVVPGTGAPGTSGGTVLTGPAAAPSGLTHTNLLPTSAKAVWTNGDTSVGVTTRVYRAPDVAGSPGAFTLLGSVGAGISEYLHTGLTSGNTYWTKVEHVKNGLVSSSVQASFTVQAADYVPPPGGFTAEAIYTGENLNPVASLSWEMGAAGLYTQVFRRLSSGSYSTLPYATAPADETWWQEWFPAGQIWYYKVRHWNPTTGLYSAYTSEIMVSG